MSSWSVLHKSQWDIFYGSSLLSADLCDAFCSSPFSLPLCSSSASWVCSWVWLALRQQFISCSSFSSRPSFATRVPSWAHLNMPEQSWKPPKTAQMRFWFLCAMYQDKHEARVQWWDKAIGCVRCCVTYFFSRLCLSLVISETRCSRLSQRSRVSLNLAFMLFTWMDKVSMKSH